MTALRMVAAFLAGSLPFSYLIGKALGKDLRRLGSKNPGATNLYRVAGPGPGLLGLGLDAAKGILATLFLAPSPAWRPLAGLLAVLGHSFSPFLGFRGGKGVATAAGVLGVVAPIPFALALLSFGLALALARYVSLASCVSALVLGVASILTPSGPWVRPTCVLLSILVLFRHRANLERLWKGTEPKFRFGR